MIYLELFLAFLKVGCFSFGGAYGAIPLIRDVVLTHGWLDDEALSYMIAVSESTPGPIMVNMATYVGSSEAGVLGAIIATFAVVLPSFLIIVLIMVLLKNAMKNQYVRAVLRGLKPCVTGIILATGAYMVITNCIENKSANIHALVITAVLILSKAVYPIIRKKKLSPIMLIIISAISGMIVYGI